MSFRFRYDPALLERFPHVQGGVLHALGVTNVPVPDDLRSEFAAEQRRVLAQIGDTPLSELPSLAAWRRAFRAFGVDPTGYRSAAEALLRRLTKQGDIPSINTLVDIGNLISIRYALPVAVFDQRAMHGGTTVRFATGAELFTDLGSSERQAPEPGEVIFVDEAGLVSARRWCWRQSAESASGADTRELLITVEAQHDGGAEAVASALRDLEELVTRHTRPVRAASGLVGAGSPSFAGLGDSAVDDVG